MTSEEREILGALAVCRLRWHDGSFVRAMTAVAGDLTPGQRDFLYRLRWRYRKQVSDCVPGRAEGERLTATLKERRDKGFRHARAKMNDLTQGVQSPPRATAKPLPLFDGEPFA